MALRHLAIIMDGNRRWARQNALKILAGHYHGAQNLKTIARSVAEHGIQHLTVFAFSRENWKRSQAEISSLLGLMRKFLKKMIYSSWLMMISDCSLLETEQPLTKTCKTHLHMLNNRQQHVHA